ncbi:hypothetical protein [Aureimonas sp. AU4]|uniref:hypothetical protein n=1 Tax=Aureimonas sp. AU4 TaxID=1638163 RepID=UPI0012E33615|nr:hypothetical protein [Aureimonas sp. AU4]
MFPNRGDAAAPTGGDWQLSLLNLQNRILQLVARSRDLQLTSTQMVIPLDRARSVRALVFINTNASTSARKRVRAYGLPSEAEPDGALLWQTGDAASDGWEDVYPRERPTARMQWRDTNFWSGKPVPEDLAGSTQSIITIMPQLFYIVRFTVEFDDQANPDGFLDLGRLFVAGQWQFSVNMKPGQQIGFMARSTSARSLGGTLYHSRKRHPRTLRGDWDYLPEDEALSQLYELLRRAGTDAEIFFVAKPDDIVNRQRLSFLCRQSELTPIGRGTAPGRDGQPGRAAGALILEEII